MSRNRFRVHPGCRVNQNSVPFYGWIIFHPMDRPRVIHLLMDTWVVSTFGLRWMTQLRTSMHKHPSWVPAFSPFVFVPRSGIAGSYGNSVTSFLRKVLIFEELNSKGNGCPAGPFWAPGNRHLGEQPCILNSLPTSSGEIHPLLTGRREAFLPLPRESRPALFALHLRRSRPCGI